MVERHTKIIELINQYKKVEVNKLSELLNVSSVTIRKDLDTLEEKGLLAREHGYALMKDPVDINNRLAIRYETKVKLAEAAAKMVSDGETIMIESGSSCALLAEVLSQSRKDITIITNSAFIAGYVRGSGDAKVILLGGEYQKESQMMIGPLVRICAREFHVDKLFVGTDGFDSAYGFSGSDLMRKEAMKCLADSASKTIVVTDSSKFARKGVVVRLRYEEVHGVITDSGISDSVKALFEKQHVRVTIV